MVFKGGYVFAVILGCLLSIEICPIFAANESYDQIFQDGLKAEANQKWADAIQYYVLAMAKNPKSPWPKERLKSVFTTLQKLELPVETYKSLLSPELLEEFNKTGVFKDHYDGEGAVRKLNTWMWAGAIGFVAFLGLALLFFSLRSSRAEKRQFDAETELEKKKSIARVAASTAQKTSESKSPNIPANVNRGQNVSKKEVKINEQTRANITGVVANVKSLNLDENKISELTGGQKVDVDGLLDSGVLNAFVKDWVTEVNVEQTETGKFSKMTVDASLLFDDDKNSDDG